MFPNHYDAYELRLVDDDESPYAPFYEIASLGYNECIGEFDSLAFMEVKNFKVPTKSIVSDP